MILKLWDINMDSGPTTFQVYEYLRAKLCDLYENDCIFDKSECCSSVDSKRVSTVSQLQGNIEATTLEVCKNPMSFTKKLISKVSWPKTHKKWFKVKNKAQDIHVDDFNYEGRDE